MNADEVQMLNDYAKEVGAEALPLQDLIASHRRLRDMSKRTHAEWIKALENAREIGTRQGMELVLTGYVSLDDLQKMTIKEIVDKYFIAGYGEK